MALNFISFAVVEFVGFIVVENVVIVIFIVVVVLVLVVLVLFVFLVGCCYWKLLFLRLELHLCSLFNSNKLSVCLFITYYLQLELLV